MYVYRMDSSCPQSWTDGLQKYGNYYSGFVQELESVLESHRVNTTTTWGTRTSTTYGPTKGGRKRGGKENQACEPDSKQVSYYR